MRHQNFLKCSVPQGAKNSYGAKVRTYDPFGNTRTGISLAFETLVPYVLYLKPRRI